MHRRAQRVLHEGAAARRQRASLHLAHLAQRAKFFLRSGCFRARRRPRAAVSRASPLLRTLAGSARDARRR